MYPLTLEASTPIATTQERRNMAQVAIDYDLYYNEGGMDAQNESDELAPPAENDLPDYM